MKKNHKNNTHLLLVTGLSGAGKTQCIKLFEDLGYFCVDNLPVALLTGFAELINRSPEHQKMTAVVIDVRDGQDFEKNLWKALEDLKKYEIPYSVLFLEASEEILVRRFSETRRKHPLSKDGGILNAILKERLFLNSIREKANFLIDTSNFSIKDFREKLLSIVSLLSTQQDNFKLNVTIISFGYKSGVPIDSDIVMDVRFLPNPFYDCDLREYNGLHGEIVQYVLDNQTAREFIEKITALLLFVIPLYQQSGKNQITIAFGCTGGKHRSVAIAELMHKTLINHSYCVNVEHRDIYNDDQIKK
jgi:RNase adapter protein RapZ